MPSGMISAPAGVTPPRPPAMVDALVNEVQPSECDARQLDLLDRNFDPVDGGSSEAF